MDKEWMSKDRLSREFDVGVESFLQFALKNAILSDAIPCPCARCGNLRKKNVETIRAHLYCNGMDLTYHTWIWHGERSTKGNSMNDNDRVGQDEHKSFSEEPVDMVHCVYESYAENPSQFNKLLEDADKPLYPGCAKFTKLSAVVKLFNLKAKYSWSDKSFTDLLILFGEMLPDHNELPSSLYDAKKSLRALGMDYVKIHACPNDCILYRKEYEDFANCPTCGTSRWKLGNKSKVKEGIPAKVLWYFPPIPRFQRMFRNKAISKELTWHADKRIRDGYLRHPADSPSWKLVDRMWPDFSYEPRNLRLAISADGINPHSLMSSAYSCWPVLMITYNLSPWLCMKRKFVMLTLLISGPRQPGNDIDVYLAPLIDDLKCLWDKGVEAYDAYREESFSLRAVLLWTINDFPAYGNMSGCVVKGYHACPICAEETYSTRLKHCRKMSYTGHRRFLPLSHPYRRQKKAFNGKQEFNLAPKPLSGNEILERVQRINYHCGKFSGKLQSKNDDGITCWKKKSIFFELEYWKDLHVRHVLDVMHIEKNVCESLIGTLLDVPGKTKDGVAARLDLLEMNLRTELAPKIGEKKTFLPAACYTLSKDEKRSICNSLSGVKVPVGYSSNFRNLVSMKDLKLVGLKSHDYHTLMQQLLPVAIRGVLPKHVRDTITRLCFFFNLLYSKVIDVLKLDDLQREIVLILCSLEKYFPPSFFDIMIHLTVHLVREVKLCGPVWYRHMYPFERFMKILKGYVRNRNRPEGCIAECYIAEEAVEFCSDYLSNVHTIGIPSRHREVELTKPLSGAVVHSTSHDELQQAHRYVLTNDVEIDPYVEEHMVDLKSRFPHKAKSKKFLQDEHNRRFTNWLRDTASELCDDDDINRAIIWKKGRVNKQGDFDGQELQITVEKIDDYIQQKREGKLEIKEKKKDILTKALNSDEHGGRVRAVGGHITPTLYFNVGRSWKTEDVDRELMIEQKKELIEARKLIQEQDTRIQKLEAIVYKKGAWDSEIEDKGSCSVKLHQVNESEMKIDKFFPSYEDLNDVEIKVVEKSVALQGKPVILTLDSSNDIVAYGTVVEVNGANNLLHGVPLPQNCMRVSIDEAMQKSALLPVPIPNECENVGDAVGTHVAWPNHLIMLRQEKRQRNKTVSFERNQNLSSNVPRAVRMVYCYCKRALENGRKLAFLLDHEVFADDYEVNLHFEDISPLYHFEPISGNCVVVYIWHLYKKMVKENKIDKFRFVNPHSIPNLQKNTHDKTGKIERLNKRASSLADRLSGAAMDQLVLVPSCCGFHWTLTVIEPYKEIVYLVDSLSHRIRDEDWKYVVEMALRLFNSTKGRKGRKHVQWEVIKAPKQPDEKQCGYYVMRFMRQITEEVATLEGDSLRLIFTKTEYSMEEIDEVRTELAECIQDHIYE